MGREFGASGGPPSAILESDGKAGVPRAINVFNTLIACVSFSPPDPRSPGRKKPVPVWNREHGAAGSGFYRTDFHRVLAWERLLGETGGAHRGDFGGELKATSASAPLGGGWHPDYETDLLNCPLN